MAQQIVRGRIADRAGRPLQYDLNLNSSVIKEQTVTRMLALNPLGEMVWMESNLFLNAGGVDPTALHTDIANELDKMAEVTPAAADKFLVEDADDSWRKKAVIFSVLESTLNHDSLTGFVAAEHYRWDTDISGTATIHPNNVVDGSDASAIHDDTASEITAVTEKASVADNDEFLGEDSAASNVKKSYKWSTMLADVSLQDAYEKGNASTPAGAIVDVSANTFTPIKIFSGNLTAAGMLWLSWQAAGSLVDNTVGQFLVQAHREHQFPTLVTDDWVQAEITRESEIADASGEIVDSGSVLLLRHLRIETAGT